MVKTKRSQIILFLLFIVISAIAVSCSKPECKTSSDCVTRKCYLLKCNDKKCSYSLLRNCCGNKLTETTENGQPGNKCSCPDDYGKCEGKGKVKAGSRMENATYLHYLCDSYNQCVFGVDEKDVVRQNLLDTISTGFFKASVVMQYNKPFDVAGGSFDFTASLDDTGKDLVLPVALTKIKLLYTGQNARVEQLIAEKDLDMFLNAISNKVIISTPLTFSYRPQEIEEQGSLRYSIDYTYTKRVSTGRAPDGTMIYAQEVARSTFTSTAKPVFFVASG